MDCLTTARQTIVTYPRFDKGMLPRPMQSSGTWFQHRSMQTIPFRAVGSICLHVKKSKFSCQILNSQASKNVDSELFTRACSRSMTCASAGQIIFVGYNKDVAE